MALVETLQALADMTMTNEDGRRTRFMEGEGAGQRGLLFN